MLILNNSDKCETILGFVQVKFLYDLRLGY